MTTPLLRPHATLTVGPLAEPVVVPVPQVVHAEGFESDIGGWTFASPATAAQRTATVTAAPARTGTYMLAVYASSPFATQAVRTVSDLVIGRTYTLRGWAGRNSSGKSARVGVTGLGYGSWVSGWIGGVSAWKECTYTFIATATSHELVLEGTYTSGGSGGLASPDVWDDVSLTAHESDTKTPPLGVTEGSVTLDAMAVPYASARLTVPLTDPQLAEQIDPRDGLRALLTAGDEVAGTQRTFNLGVRGRVVDHKQKTIEVDLASDEAILQEYAPLTDDTATRALSSSLRSVCNYVLRTALPPIRRNLFHNPWTVPGLANPSLHGEVTGGTDSGRLRVTHNNGATSGNDYVRHRLGAMKKGVTYGTPAAAHQHHWHLQFGDHAQQHHALDHAAQPHAVSCRQRHHGDRHLHADRRPRHAVHRHRHLRGRYGRGVHAGREHL